MPVRPPTLNNMDETPETQNEETQPAEVNFAPQSVSVPDDQSMPVFQQLGLALGALLLIFGFSYIPGVLEREAEDDAAPEEVSAVSEEPQFGEVRVSAEAAYVWDVKNQRALYNKNAGQQLPLASLTKLMTALVAYEHLSADAEVSIPDEAIQQEGDSLMASGEVFRLSDLVDLTLLTSSNDGAYALAYAAGATTNGAAPVTAFISSMNAKAEEIGLLQSHFKNPTGLDMDEEASGSYGTARDMAFLMEYLLVHHPYILEETTKAETPVYDQMGALFTAVNTNEAVYDIPGFIGSKTGYTDLAGGNLVIAFDAGLNRPIVISVLGSTREGRFADALALIRATQAYLSHTP